MDAIKDIKKRRAKFYMVVLLIALLLVVLAGCASTQAEVKGDLTVEEPGNIIAKFLLVLNKGIGNLGWTVVVFTIILKVALSPLDFWQKHIMRKNAKIMERMKPKLEKLQKQYGNNKEEYSRRQMAMYKEEKYSMMGPCLPTIITLVVFMLVFNGFNKMVNYENAKQYAELANVYQSTYNQVIAGATIPDDPTATEIAAAVDAGQTAVAEAYDTESWLWIKNVFVADSWRKTVPTFETFSGSGLGNMNIKGVVVSDYENVMGKVLGTGGYGKNGSWNGLLLLPLMAVALQFLTQKLTNKQQTAAQPPQMAAGGTEEEREAAAKMNAGSMKMMQYMMPIIFGIFALFYSSAFTIYLFTSSAFSVIFQVVYNLIAKQKDKKDDEARLSSTYK